MSQGFVGRAEELGVLNAAYASRKGEFYPVYGRRRVGKTELLLKFIEKKPSVFYLGKLAPAETQIAEFMELAASSLGQPLLAEARPQTWRKALELVVGQAPKGKKLVLVLDEFQWMVERSPELPSILQELWDMEWSRTGKVFLVLCGSYIGFMEREVLGKKSPLFGRRTGQILLQPFGHREAAAFHPRLALEERAQVWFLCGGIPYYLRQFTEDRSIAMNIQKTYLSPHSPMHREADFLIREELREVERYHSILMVLAKGSQPAAVVAKGAHIPSGNIQYYLKTLVELGYIERRYPMIEGRPAARAVRFTLCDPLLQFWFRFIFPKLSRVTVLGAAEGFRQLIKPELDGYFGLRFEQLVRAALPAIYARDGVDAACEIGAFWNKEVQIDVVSIRDDEADRHRGVQVGDDPLLASGAEGAGWEARRLSERK